MADGHDCLAELWGGWDFPLELPADFEIDWVKAWVPDEGHSTVFPRPDVSE